MRRVEPSDFASRDDMDRLARRVVGLRKLGFPLWEHEDGAREVDRHTGWPLRHPDGRLMWPDPDDALRDSLGRRTLPW